MELWGFIILGVFALGVLMSIGNDVRSISLRLQDSNNKHLSDLPERIAKAIIWELDMNSALPKNISHELLVMGDFPEKIAKEIGFELMVNKDLPEKIAESISRELNDPFGLGQKIESTIRKHLESINTKLDR